MRQVLRNVTILLLCTTACFRDDAPGPTEPNDLATAGATGPSKIAFNSWDGGRASIYVVNSNGSGLTNLTPAGQDDRRPLWSPDRSKIAFVQRIVELWVMSSDGRNRVRLTNRLADGLGDPGLVGQPAVHRREALLLLHDSGPPR
jgi:hypothetical protein